MLSRRKLFSNLSEKLDLLYAIGVLTNIAVCWPRQTMYTNSIWKQWSDLGEGIFIYILGYQRARCVCARVCMCLCVLALYNKTQA
jgi:hypothetical protein